MQSQSTFNIVRSEEPYLFVVERVNSVGEKMRGVFKVTSSDRIVVAKLREPYPKAILISFDLGEKEATELCSSIKHHRATSHIPVIMFAPEMTESLELEGLEAGANDVIPLGASEELVTLRIDRLVQRLSRIYHRSSFLERVDEILFNHLEFSVFHVERLAEHLNMDRKTLYRRIKKESGHPPKVYIRNIRICRGAHLLKRGTLTVSQVAFQVGFADASYFSKCFKEYFKITPMKFATKYWH